MQSVTRNGGEISQDSAALPLRRSVESAPRVLDPASRRAHRAFDSLSASSVGLELGLSVVLALLAGWWLDQRLGTEPILMLVMLGFGLVAGFRGMLRSVHRAERAAKAERRG